MSSNVALESEITEILEHFQLKGKPIFSEFDHRQNSDSGNLVFDGKMC